MSVPIRYHLLIFFLISSICVNAQHKKIKTYYKDGRIESKGSIYTYPIYLDSKTIPKKWRILDEIHKKEKQWKYWNRNGQLNRIENYKLIIDKNYNDLPDGEWIYFNDVGNKYRVDLYDNGILINSIKEIYQDTRLAGKVSLSYGISDTSLYLPLTKENNLIINSDFDFFYYKPMLITYNGKNKIEDWIPFWITPGEYTPDYISNLRYIDALSYFYLFDMPLPENFQYVGIALYKESEDYSEYIQGKLITPLIKGERYCLRTSLNLCSYSRYSSNRIAFYLSPSAVSVDSKNESTFLPQVVFSYLPVENKQFTTLCDHFIADGGEQIITVGRFSKPENLFLIKRDSIPQSVFGLEKASYYLIDKIELFEIQDTSECYCKTNINLYNLHMDQPNEIYETDLNKLRQGVPVVLENVNFEFDSFVLIKSSETILNTLLNYLNNNPDIRIIIEGHTDDIGTEDYNLELSINRAKSVYNWLITKGIDSTRLSFTGFGKSRPLYNDTEEKHRALNRRVEVRIIKDGFDNRPRT
jgi:outer membrane protein OmpA-like peptidoglycan-associated protein/antitoxin component YwqK of YwqJK toxin-antitoxin module